MTTGRSPGIGITVRQISASETLPLRHSVLRPGLPRETAVFAGDDLQDTAHWGAFAPGGHLAAVGSLYRAPHPHDSRPGWQLRGMASAPEFRGQGYAAALLDACLEWVRATEPGALVWCNARESAVGFYLRHGFVVEGDVFDLPTVGPHFVMSRRV